MDYWVRLADIIEREAIHERDRFFMAMLKSIGIEKGKPFNPDERRMETRPRTGSRPSPIKGDS